MIKTLLSAAFACTLALSALGQTAFTFQGRLASAGAPYSGSADLQVSAFDAASGGTLISGPVTVSNVTVTSGLYTTQLDLGQVFGAGSRWLEIAVRTPSGVGAFTVVSPREPVTPAPVASSLTGMSALAAVDISQTIISGIIGSDPPLEMIQTFKPTVSGRLLQVTVRYQIPGPVSIPCAITDGIGVPLAGGTASFQATGSGFVDAVFVFSSPLYLNAGTSYGLRILAGNGTTFPAAAFASGNRYPDGVLNNDLNSDLTFTTTMESPGRLFNQNVSFAQRVGIGTSTPQSSLHVAPIDGIMLGKNAFSGGYTALALSLTSESGGSASIQAIKNAGSNYGNLLLNPELGNVGIGQPNPIFRLDVTSPSDGNVLRLSSATTATTLSLTNTAAGGRNYSLLSNSLGTLSIRDVGAAQDRLTLFSNGRVALGFAAAPDSTLEIHGDANSTALSAKSGPGNGAIGLYASGVGPGVKAGVFDGNVTINGNLVVNGSVAKNGGSFRIPHPLDPEHRWLSHSFVESPDMMNIYNGVITLNQKGEAEVELPDYFEILNRDFRYQLTPIGASMPNLFIAREVEHNSFAIAGGKPGAKVSWSVTGIRQDEKAKSHPIVVDRTKDPLND